MQSVTGSLSTGWWQDSVHPSILLPKTQRNTMYNAESRAPNALLHCHLMLSPECPEPLCHFIVRHLTELIADVFRIPRSTVAIRVDSAPPARHFVGGRPCAQTETCLVTLLCWPENTAPNEFVAPALRFLRDTFGPSILDSQIRIVGIAPQLDNIAARSRD